MVGYFKNHNILLESYLEDHILDSNYYKMIFENNIVGYFSIFKENTLTSFCVFKEVAFLEKELFFRVRAYESVMNAMVMLGDSIFLSNALDNYVKIEKQANLARYERDVDSTTLVKIKLALAESDEDYEKLHLAEGFLDDEVKKVRRGTRYLKIYIVELENTIVGFGIVEYGVVAPENASIGMYVIKEHRGKGIGSSILYNLRQIIENEGRVAISGNWYYNHNSIKTQFKAGANRKSQLLKIYF